MADLFVENALGDKMLLTTTTRKANPHRTNLVITTDARRSDYRFLDMGFVWHYSHETLNKDSWLYDTCYYEMPQLLIPRIHDGYLRDGVDYTKVVDVIRQARWSQEAKDLYTASVELQFLCRRFLFVLQTSPTAIISIIHNFRILK
jgi:hypothetical protein